MVDGRVTGFDRPFGPWQGCGLSWTSPTKGMLAIALAVGFAYPAEAQLAGGGLTNGGFTGSGGSLRDTVSSLLSPPANVNLGIPFTFSGDVDVEAGATTSAGGVNQNLQPLLLISPDLNLRGVTSRLNVSLSYSPRLAYYPESGSQTLFSNTFNGDATVTLYPDWLFLNVRGVTGLTSRFGGTSDATSSFYTNSDAVQTSSFSVSPYLQHTFGGAGTLTVGYTYAATFQDAYNNLPFYAPNSTATAGYGTIGNLQTSTESASFATGENLGRVQDTVSITASQNTGSTFYNDSSTIQANNQVSYALYRWLTLLGNVGYEEYNYPSNNYSLSDVTWSVGATVLPNADSSITVEYGRKAGTNTILSNFTYSPTARTRIYGGYNVDIETGAGARQNLLNSTTVGPGGILVDRATGNPVLGNSYLASQFSLSRIKTLSVGGVLQLDRDTFSASVGRSDVQQLINSTDVFGISTPAGTSTSSTYGTLGWEHDLNPSNFLNTTVSYGTSSTGAYFGSPGSSQDTLQFYTSLTHIFTDTLSGSVSFSHQQRFGDALRNLPAVYGGNATQDTFLVGLRKSF